MTTFVNLCELDEFQYMFDFDFDLFLPVQLECISIRFSLVSQELAYLERQNQTTRLDVNPHPGANELVSRLRNFYLINRLAGFRPLPRKRGLRAILDK